LNTIKFDPNLSVSSRNSEIEVKEARKWFESKFGDSKFIENQEKGLGTSYTISPVWAFSSKTTYVGSGIPIVIVPVETINFKSVKSTSSFLVFYKNKTDMIDAKLIVAVGKDDGKPTGLSRSSFSGCTYSVDLKGVLENTIFSYEQGVLTRVWGFKYKESNTSQIESVVTWTPQGGNQETQAPIAPPKHLHLFDYDFSGGGAGGGSNPPTGINDYPHTPGGAGGNDPIGPTGPLDLLPIIDPLQVVYNYLGFDGGDTNGSQSSYLPESEVFDFLLQSQALFLANYPSFIDPFFDFLESQNHSTVAKNFVRSLINMIVQNSLLFVTIEDINQMFNNPSIYNQIKAYLADHPNLTNEDKQILMRMIILPPNTPINNLASRLDCFETNNNLLFNHKVTLYIDQPKAGTNNSVNVNETAMAGHTWLKLQQIPNDGTSPIFLTIGFYPKDPPGASPVTQSAPGNYNDDSGHPSDVNVTWNVSSYAFNQMVNHMQSTLVTPVYNLSCTTWALDQLSYIQIDLPRTIVNSSYLIPVSGLTPGQLGQDLRYPYVIPQQGSVLFNNNTSPVSNCQ
jgi:hypothetical protein